MFCVTPHFIYSILVFALLMYLLMHPVSLIRLICCKFKAVPVFCDWAPLKQSFKSAAFSAASQSAVVFGFPPIRARLSIWEAGRTRNGQRFRPIGGRVYAFVPPPFETPGTRFASGEKPLLGEPSRSPDRPEALTAPLASAFRLLHGLTHGHML